MQVNQLLFSIKKKKKVTGISRYWNFLTNIYLISPYLNFTCQIISPKSMKEFDTPHLLTGPRSAHDISFINFTKIAQYFV